jgi:hypothetical protein
MNALPEIAHISIALHTALSKEHVVDVFRHLGWRVRKCSWVDFEVASGWAELILESDRPMLFHGCVLEALPNAEPILVPLREAGIGYDAELYSEDRELLQELRWRPS